MPKTRPDQLLVERGLAESRTRAQALILAGLVFSGDKRVDKPGTLVAPGADLRLTAKQKFVSRGGDKLSHALVAFAVSPKGRVCLDVGASTLESLAAGGDRMVGVVTHVGALAERVPVRFAVSRDQRTSSITREDLAG